MGASEVTTTLRRYTNLFTVIIIVIVVLVLSFLNDALLFELVNAAVKADQCRRFERETLRQVGRNSAVDDVLQLMQTHGDHHV